MVTHSGDVAARASRIVRLADGRIVADETLDRRLPVGLAR
jgi:ABC-type lipoprotein export system ATPase subunit